MTFPRCFSPLLVNTFPQLFAAGNAVLEGTPGCGKSMLLSLLRSDVRLAFEQSTEKYPEVPQQFINAGINLASNNALRLEMPLPIRRRFHSCDRPSPSTSICGCFAIS